MHYNIHGDTTVEPTHATYTLQYIKNVVYKENSQNFTYFTEMGYDGYAHVISVSGIKYVRKWIEENLRNAGAKTEK